MDKRSLSARDALNIAAQHGFAIRHSNWERKLIRDSIIAARAAARCPDYGARRKSAIQYFDSYMTRTRAAIKEDSKTYGVRFG